MRSLRFSRKANRLRSKIQNRALRIQSLETRRLLAGDAPTFVEVGDQTVEVGSPLHLPIDGFDADGGPLTVTVEISDPDAVTAEVISGNRSLRLDVASFGTMIFELYEGRVPRPTGRVIELAEDGFYDGIIFHRVDSDFVLQAGSPDGSGATGSDLGTFDDQFHPDLQHNQVGTLSFAKTSSDDSNNSQFFVTAADTRFLDYNHSVFGQLVEGEDVRQAISEVPIDPETERPLTDVVITSATIFEDIENSVVMLRAIDAEVQSDVTITITDAEGNASSETLSVNTITDQDDAGPYLVDPAPVILAPAGEDFVLPLSAVDLEGDPAEFLAALNRNDFGTSNIDPGTQLLEPLNDQLQLELDEGFVGSIGVIVGVRAVSGNLNHIDTQDFEIQVVDSLATPTSIDLSAASDTGIADDNITAASSLTVEVDGVTAGADIEIVDQASGEVLGQMRATETTASVEIDLVDDFFGENQLNGVLEVIARQRTGNLLSEVGDSLAIQIDRTAPQLTSPSLPDQLFAGTLLSETLTTDETSGRFSLLTGPNGMMIDEATGQLSWTPDGDVRGLQSVTIGIQDDAGNTSESMFSINVTSKFVNALDRFDVDGSGRVDSFDALLVINIISRNGGEIQLPETESSSLSEDFFYNASDDDSITALDALVIMNEVARRQDSGTDIAESEPIDTLLGPSSIRLEDGIDDELDQIALLF